MLRIPNLYRSSARKYITRAVLTGGWLTCLISAGVSVSPLLRVPPSSFDARMASRCSTSNSLSARSDCEFSAPRAASARSRL
jgi:hypothetical protein